MFPAGQPQPVVSTLNAYQGQIVANAAIVPAGTSGSVDVYASDNTNVIIDINGYYAAPTDASADTAIGTGALASNATGYANTAIGSQAMASNTTGWTNTAIGSQALYANTTGADNTATGQGALQNNI